MRILLLGSAGQVGWELERTLIPLGQILSYDRSTLDMSDLDQLRSVVRTLSPDLIINAAAYTAVDKAESEPELAFQVNAEAPGLLAEEAESLGACLIHYSTDYVFDGLGKRPYRESDPTNPINVYGASKLAGEESIAETNVAHWILRTSWVYSMRRDCFPMKVLKWVREKPEVSIASDQTGSPTWCRMLAEITAQLITTQNRLMEEMEKSSGVYHVAGRGFADRYEFAQAILELDPEDQEHIATQLLPARSEDFPKQARRPASSALDCSKFMNTFGLRIPDWRQGLHRAMQDFQSARLEHIYDPD